MLHRSYELQWLQGLVFIFFVSTLVRLYVFHAVLAKCCVHKYERYAFCQMIGHQESQAMMVEMAESFMPQY
jgi:hypothetical protein